MTATAQQLAQVNSNNPNLADGISANAPTGNFLLDAINGASKIFDTTIGVASSGLDLYSSFQGRLRALGLADEQIPSQQVGTTNPEVTAGSNTNNFGKYVPLLVAGVVGVGVIALIWRR